MQDLLDDGRSRTLLALSSKLPRLLLPYMLDPSNPSQLSDSLTHGIPHALPAVILFFFGLYYMLMEFFQMFKLGPRAYFDR